MSKLHKFEKKRAFKGLSVPKVILMSLQKEQEGKENPENFEQALKASEDFIHRFENSLGHLVKG
jgi:hypothetical protein